MSQWEWIAAGSGAVVAVAVLVVLLWLRRRGVRFVGPMFWYELVKLARRGHQPRLRALLVSLLLVGLFITYLREFEGEELAALTGGTQLSLDRSARFAHTFLVTFLSAQLLAVILITPAIVCSAIAEEKERGTLDFLRSSLLTNREIILGKLAARLAFVGGVVLAGVPVLALTSLFGGVDLYVLLGGYVITGMTALSLGAFSLWLGVIRDSLRDVLVWVYGVTLGLTVFGSCCGCIPGVAAFSPPSAMGFLFVHPQAIPSEPLFWGHLLVFTVLHGIATAVFTLLAVVRVRSAPPRRRPPPRTRYRPQTLPPKETAPLPVARRPGAPRPVAKPVPEDDHDDEEEDDWRDAPMPRARRSFQPARMKDGDPFLWKERYFSGRLSWVEGGVLTGCGVAAVSVIGFILGMVLFFSALSELNQGRWIGGAVNPVARLFLTGAAMLLGLGLGTRSASSVAWERQRQTLDGLLMIPVDRGVLLRAKWLAPVVWARWALGVVAIAAALSLLSGGVHPVGLVIALLQIVGWLVFANTLGLWLSVRCPTVTRATVYFLVGVLATWFGPLALTPVVTTFTGEVGEVTARFSLPVGVWEALFSWNEAGEELMGPRAYLGAAQLAGVVAGILYLLGAVGLWLDAVRRFENEGR